MKRGIASLVIVMPLLATLMLFQACSLPGSESKLQNVQPAQRPTWAVNKYGNIDLYILNLDSVIAYDPNEGYKTTYTLSYRSNLYTGGEGKYRVSYEIISSILGIIDRGSADIGEASYESSSGFLYPSEGDIKDFNFEIPKNLEGLMRVYLVVNYNISGLKTKINIPIDVKRPPSGTILNAETSIFYSASPLIPTSDKAGLAVLLRKIIVTFNVSDFGGCLRDHSRSSNIAYKAKLIYAGRETNIVSCGPSSLKSFPAQIICTINIDGDNDIRTAFMTGTNIHLELNIEIGPYNCTSSKSYTIQVKKYT